MHSRFHALLSHSSRIDINFPPDAQNTPDWLEYVRGQRERHGDEFDLTQLQTGDRLLVVTQRTVYRLAVVGGREAMLETDRPGRPEGRVRIIGCSLGMSSSLKPDHLFCGGSLRFSFRGGSMIHTTTAIREIGWRRDASR